MLQGFGGDGASTHAHLIAVLFKTEPIRQEVSCFMGASGMGMVLANMQTRSIIFHGSGGMVLADMPTWLQYHSNYSPIDKRYHTLRVLGDGASRHAHLIAVLFKTHPIRQEVSCFMGWGGHAHLIAVLFKTQPIRQKVSYFKGLGDGASRHAHFITVSFKTQPIRQEVSCFMGAFGVGMVLANMPAW